MSLQVEDEIRHHATAVDDDAYLLLHREPLIYRRLHHEAKELHDLAAKVAELTTENTALRAQLARQEATP